MICGLKRLQVCRTVVLVDAIHEVYSLNSRLGAFGWSRI
jgi:hypothetical protein